LDVREKFHSVRLGEVVNAFNPTTGERLDAVARHFIAQGADAVAAGQQALGAVAGVVRREAYVMAYGDCFFLIGAVLLAMVLLVWLCRGTERRHVAGLHGSNGLSRQHAGAPGARAQLFRES
jgi:DHA2 family multidrug resistance protein